MVVGIFTSWELTFLQSAETIFKRNLEENPTFPFTPLGPHLYALRVRTSRWVVGIVAAVITVLSTALAYSIGSEVDEFIIFPFIVLLGCLSIAFYHAQERTFVLDTYRHLYEFYRGHKLVYSGHVHNLYIQLKGQNPGGGDTFYQVVLNGYLVDEEPITNTTIHKERLAVLARQLAGNLDLNYFDEHPRSRYHVIRHRCPYEKSRTDSSGSLS